jgi:hypothetical protein
MSDPEATVQEQTAERSLSTDIEADPIAEAAQTVTMLQTKRASLLDRINVNRSTSAEIAFAAFTDGGKPRKALDDLGQEAASLERELALLDHAVAEAQRRLELARTEQAAAAERGRAQLARERFNEFGKLAQEFSDRIDDVVRLFGALREASAAVHETGYGPNERQTTRWAQRLIVFRCQHDRNLKFEDLMVDGRERL